MFGRIFNFVSDTVESVANISVGAVATALGVTTDVVRAAMRAGCKTEREIKRWIEENT